MFGTAIADFTKYPSLFIPANKLYQHIRSEVANHSNEKDKDRIDEKSIDTWAKIHGLVGLLRKLQSVPSKVLKIPDTPIIAINKISKDLDGYLERFIEKI